MFIIGTTQSNALITQQYFQTIIEVKKWQQINLTKN